MIERHLGVCNGPEKLFSTLRSTLLGCVKISMKPLTLFLSTSAMSRHFDKLIIGKLVVVVMDALDESFGERNIELFAAVSSQFSHVHHVSR